MKPHIVFLPSPGMGHITPLFQLAKRLVLHYHCHVSFLVITTKASAAQNNFFNSPSALIPDLHIINLPPADISSFITHDMKIVTQICVMIRESIKPLKSILANLNPTSVIIDIFTTDAIDACKELSIPVYSFFTASTTLLTFSLYLPTLDLEVEGEFVHLPVPIEIPGCRAMRTVDILDQVKDRKNAEYDWYLLHVSRLRFVDGIFLNSWEDLDIDRIKTLKENPFYQKIPISPVFPIGPLIKEDETLTEIDAQITNWLDNQPNESVLFVCLGSGGTLSSKQLTELAWGLEMSKQRFILVVRKPTDASASDAYFGNGCDENDPSAYLPGKFVEKTRGIGLVVPSWAPQIAVLRHSSTGAFLSHCGWNSTLESLVHGVPIIAWPLYAEQRMNATILVEEVGVGVKIEKEEGEEIVGRKTVEKVVREVMEGEKGRGIRDRAKELEKSAAKALGVGGSSIKSLNDVVDIWKSQI